MIPLFFHATNNRYMEEIVKVNELDKMLDSLYKLVIDYVPQFLGAIFLLIIGLWLISKVSRVAKSRLDSKKVDDQVVPYLITISSVALKIILIISVASMVGIATSSFIAILGAAGLAIGLALQGSLSNFAGGILILSLKPFKKGDFISAQGEMGEVDRIEIFHTYLRSPDNKRVILPNGPLANGNVLNFTAEGTRRLDMVIGVSYDANIKETKEVIESVLNADARILKDPEITVRVLELADSSVNFAVRPWVRSEDYWDVHFSCHEEIKIALDKAGIAIPFPQRDVHLIQE